MTKKTKTQQMKLPQVIYARPEFVDASGEVYYEAGETAVAVSKKGETLIAGKYSLVGIVEIEADVYERDLPFGFSPVEVPVDD